MGKNTLKIFTDNEFGTDQEKQNLPLNQTLNRIAQNILITSTNNLLNYTDWQMDEDEFVTIFDFYTVFYSWKNAIISSRDTQLSNYNTLLIGLNC